MSVRALKWSRAFPGLAPGVRAGGSLPWLLLLLVAVCTLTPVAAALLSAFRSAAPGQAGDWTLDGLARAFSQSTTWEALWTTYWLSAVRALLGVSVAVGHARVPGGNDRPLSCSVGVPIALGV